MMSPNWVFDDIFGDQEDGNDIKEEDILSTVKHSENGQFLAVGDKSGRLVIFKRTKRGKQVFYKEIESHTRDFDSLRSTYIDQEIKSIEWIKASDNRSLLLSANEKSIKLWKITDKIGSLKEGKGLSVINDENIESKEINVFKNGHLYDINDISFNNHTGNILSADDLQIHLWNIENPKKAYNIIDKKLPGGRGYRDSITCSKFDKCTRNGFIYGQRSGNIDYVDMRVSPVGNNVSRVFPSCTQSLFPSSLLKTISDVEFSSDGRYIISRDYRSIHIWDTNMEKEPIKTIHIDDTIKTSMQEIEKKDMHHDRFKLSYSPLNDTVSTGTYRNKFRIFRNVFGENTEEINLESKRTHYRERPVYEVNKLSICNDSIPQIRDLYSARQQSLENRVLCVSLSPLFEEISVAAQSNLYIYKGYRRFDV